MSFVSRVSSPLLSHKSAELQTGRRLKKLRSDNGGEYVSQEFESYCIDQGIHHEHTIPYSPQQNGVAERKNRTLLNAVRCMLIHSGLSRVFWAEAILAAVFVQNHLPTTAPSGKIPITAWTGEIPSVSHFRTFGCIAYIHVPKETRTKLDASGLKVIFIGYSDTCKGYKFYDPSTKKVVVNRDATFNEQLMGGTWSLDDADDTKSLLQAFPFLCDDDESPSQGQLSTCQPSLSCVVNNDLDIFVDLPIEFEHGSYHIYDEDTVDNVISTSEDPTSYSEAISSLQKDQRQEAMEVEYDSLISKGTWILTKLPPGHTAIKCKWIYKTKVKANGTFNKFKARLAAKGYSQIAGVDYQETFSPVVRITSI